MHNAIVTFKANGTVHDRKTSGRPRRNTPREDRSTRQIVMLSPKSSCEKIHTILRLKGTTIRSSTGSRHVGKYYGLKWKKVLFSNVCTKQQFVPRHMHIRRPLGKPFDKKYVVATMKLPPSQMIWGVVSCHDDAVLYFIPPNAINGRTWNCSKNI